MQNGIGIQRMLCRPDRNKNIFSVCLKIFFSLIICFHIPLVHAVNEEDYKAETLSEEGSLLAQALNEENYRALQKSVATVRNGMDPHNVETLGGFFIDKNLLVTSYLLIQGLVDADDRSTFNEVMVEVITPGQTDIGVVSAVDPENNLVILKTLEDNYKPLDIGSGREVIEGETVFTIKDPNLIASKDFEKAQDVFLESSVGSRIGNEMFYYPIDGMLKRHSGLPVFSKDLKVVGIVSLASLASGKTSVFAIPLNKLKTLIEEQRDFLEIEGPLSQIRSDSVEAVQLDTYIKTPRDMMHLGLAYEFGFGNVERDPQKAFDWYEKAADQGYPEANFHLGRAYAQRGNFIKGFEKLEVAAEQGHLEAMFMTATMRYHGQGTTKDIRGAFERFEVLAEKGIADAQFMVASMIEFGQEVEQDPQKAFDWYEKAAHQGHPEANYHSGLMLMNGIGGTLPPDFKKAFERLDVAAEQGHIEARFQRAVMLYQEMGVERDIRRAFKEFEFLAKQGHLSAWFNMASMRSQGLGVIRDPRRAFEEFSVLAGGGHMDAAFRMAVMLYYGEGTVRDVPKAFEMFKSLAEQGHRGALVNKSIMLYSEPRVAQNFEEAFEGFKALAEEGDVSAMLQVGLMSYLGLGVSEKNPREAAQWFEKGAVLGDVSAQFQYARLLYLGEGLPKNVERARYWFDRSREKSEKPLCPY